MNINSLLKLCSLYFLTSLERRHGNEFMLIFDDISIFHSISSQVIHEELIFVRKNVDINY